MVQTSPPQGFVASSVIPQELWYDVRDYGADPSGVADSTTAISNAITAMPSGGGTLWFAAGNYLSARLTTTKPMRITGDKGATIKLKNTTNDDLFFVNGTSDVTIDTISIDGNKVNQANGNAIHIVNSQRCTIREVKIINSFGAAIKADTNASEISVLKCNIQSPSFNGIAFDACTSVMACHNNVDSPGSHGILAQNVTLDILFEGNIIISPVSRGIIVSVGCQYWTIAGNDVQSAGVNGIDADTTGPANTHGTITGNVCRGCTFDGISVVGAHRVAVVGNTVVSNLSNGIDIDNSNECSVTGNVSIGNSAGGITIEGTSARCVVGNNVCIGNGGYGIALENSVANTLVDGNNCQGNTTGDVNVSNSAIASTTIQNNQLLHATVKIANSGTSTLARNNVGYGTMTDNRSGVTGADGSPITLVSVPTGANQGFRFSIDIFATAFTSGTATYTLTWTENAGTRTAAVTATAINVLGTLTDLINPDASTNITVQLTGVFTATVKVLAIVEQIAA